MEHDLHRSPDVCSFRLIVRELTSFTPGPLLASPALCGINYLCFELSKVLAPDGDTSGSSCCCPWFCSPFLLHNLYSPVQDTPQNSVEISLPHYKFTHEILVMVPDLIHQEKGNKTLSHICGESSQPSSQL